MTLQECIMVIRPSDDLFRTAVLLDLPEDENGNRLIAIKKITKEEIDACPILNTVPYRPDHLK